MFRGSIKAGTVSAKFLSDFSNIDSDLLVGSYAAAGANTGQSEQAIVVPGGFATVTLAATKRGLIEIMIDTGHENESGRLIVTRDGQPHDESPTLGPVRWTYLVTE
jgi:hypothetical protein